MHKYTIPGTYVLMLSISPKPSPSLALRVLRRARLRRLFPLCWMSTGERKRFNLKNTHTQQAVVIRLTLGWIIDRSFTPVAQQVAPSHLASTTGHEFESHFEHAFSKNCLRVRLIINMSPWVPRIWIEVCVGTYDRIRRPVNRYVPKIPPFQGGENVIRLTLGWVIDRSFTPVAQQVAPSHCGLAD